MLRLFLLAALIMISTGLPAHADPLPSYTLAKTLPLGAPDRWDYLVFDGATRRVYLAHGSTLSVVDAASGELVGQVEGIAGGTHGTAISAATGQGYTDDGTAGVAVAFDLQTLKIKQTIPANDDADAVVLDPATGHVLVVNGDTGTLSVIDPKTNTAIATINTAEKMEYAAAGEPGVIYVAGNGKSDIVRIDLRDNTVTARWPTPDCAKPHGLAYDPQGRRLFMGCVNAKLMVVDTASGRAVAELAIGQGSDAIAFDPKRRRVFSSNGKDGTITVYQQMSPDSYQALTPITTMTGARTMTVDPESGRLFTAAAETDPPATPNGRPRPRPGTLRLMMFDPVR